MENYFWNTEEPENLKLKKIYILVIYDIVDNRRRVNFARRMQGYGFRVQKSAFEAMLREKTYRQLIEEIPKLINEKEDSVRVYRINGRGEVRMFGDNEIIEEEEIVII